MTEIDKAGLELLSNLPPATKEYLAEIGKESRRLAIGAILRQHQECKWASIEITREENKVDIKWVINSSRRNPEKYVVTGTVADIPLIPHPDNYSHSIICSKRGDGAISLELEEGHAYFFQFHFMDADEYTARQAEHRDGPTESLLQAILFQVAIPLSDQRKGLLRKAVKITYDPSEKVRHELEKFLNVEDAFDEMCEIAIEKIKAKHLPEAEEKDRIERFRDKAEQLKSEFGM